jgi:hypothetical protein
MKNILIIVNGIPRMYLAVSRDTKVTELKKELKEELNLEEKKESGKNIQMFVNKSNELKVFDNSKYDNMTLESIFDIMEDSKIIVSENEKIFKNIQKIGGKIRIAQQKKGVSYPNVSGFENIPCWSRGKGEWKELSPFHLKFKSGAIFENRYQAHKVWGMISKQKTKNWQWSEETHVDEKGNPNEKWKKWHQELINHDLPVRRPNGKAVPLYAWWKGRKLNVVEGRKEIYIPYLKELYRAHPVYLKLLAKFRSGKNIMLIEPDGPIREIYPDGLELNLPLLYSLIEKTNYLDEGIPDKYFPYGHGMVLATCLLEDV